MSIGMHPTVNEQAVDPQAAAGAAAAAPPARPPQSPTQSDAGSSGPVDLFKDSKSGLWTGATTIFCVSIVGVSNLILFAVAWGQASPPSEIWSTPRLILSTLVVATLVGVFVGTLVGLILGLRLGYPFGRQPSVGNPDEVPGNGRNLVTTAVVAGLAVAVAAGGLFVLLYKVAWITAAGDPNHPPAWQPIVGFTLSVVAVASFGGFYLASRRSRIGIAASFVMTFLVLLSFMLTLTGLAGVTDGPAGLNAEGAGKALQDLLKDFRGSFALIISFYFGTDAAISAVKIFTMRSSDPNEVARLDRDLAAPRS